MRLSEVALDLFRLPQSRPGLPLAGQAAPSESANAALLVRFKTDDGLTGLGVTHGPSQAGHAMQNLAADVLAPLVVGQSALGRERLCQRFREMARELGSGLLHRTWAAFDLALWDLQGQAAGLPLWQLLGSAREGVPYFVGDIAGPERDAGQIIKAGQAARTSGAMGLRAEVDGDDPEADADRIERVRGGLGDEAWLAVSAQGRLDPSTALALGGFYWDELNIDFFDDPIPPLHHSHWDWLARRVEVPLATGSTFQTPEEFRTPLERGWVQFVRPDLLRLGGLTPLLKVVALVELHGVAVMPVALPEVCVHLACGLASVQAVEQVGTLGPLWADGPKTLAGRLVPSAKPGLGLSVGESAEKYRLTSREVRVERSA